MSIRADGRRVVAIVRIDLKPQNKEVRNRNETERKIEGGRRKERELL